MVLKYKPKVVYVSEDVILSHILKNTPVFGHMQSDMEFSSCCLNTKTFGF